MTAQTPALSDGDIQIVGETPSYPRNGLARKLKKINYKRNR